MTLKVNPMELSRLVQVLTFTDPQAGTIVWHIPVDEYGAVDCSRPSLFFGHCTLQTPHGPMQLNFPVVNNVDSLASAIKEFPNALRDAVKEIEKQQLRSALLHGGPTANPNSLDLSKLNNNKKN